MKRESEHEWHVALNQYNTIGGEFRHWMYDAKSTMEEARRLPLLFKAERTQKLVKIHKQCSFSSEVPVNDNHMICALGKECRKCPHLLALDKAEMSDEDRDEAKAWTCIVHILKKPGFVDTSEGFLLTEDDKMYWQNVYSNM